MLRHADATLRHGEWQHTVPHGKDETERQSDASGVRVGMRMRAAPGLARLPARFGGTAAAQGHRHYAAGAGETSPARCDGGAGRRFRGRGGDRAALHNLLRAQFLVNGRIGMSNGPLSIQLRGDNRQHRKARAPFGKRGAFNLSVWQQRPVLGNAMPMRQRRVHERRCVPARARRRAQDTRRRDLRPPCVPPAGAARTAAGRRA